MYQTKVNNKHDYNIEVEDGVVKVNDKQVDWDMQALPDGSFSIIANGTGYIAMVDKFDKESKTALVRINNNSYEIAIKEPIDQLLEKMGLNAAANKKAEPIKAPMPGLILRILVKPGQQLKKGEPVLILEAMKMENVFKAPADAVVKAIKTEERKAVEKGAILIELE